MNCQMKKLPARVAFTLVELMIAMTVTLLLMAALGKAFAVIGRSMKEGRSQVSLSSKLRGISFRIRNDLHSRTVDARPPISPVGGQGYFTYYEGPLTEHTFGLFGAEPTQETTGGDFETPSSAGFNAPENGPTYRRLSRYGDFDDYIAFTAEAAGDDWFTGKVPAYLVDDTATDPMEPRIIRSKRAEIIIWASPVWDLDKNSNELRIATTPASPSDPTWLPSPSKMPLFEDVDRNYAPDRIVLRQRILLVRPDLNVKGRLEFPFGTGPSTVRDGGPANGRSGSGFETTYLRPMNGNVNDPGAVPAGLAEIYPIGQTTFPNYVAPGSATDSAQVRQSNWLVGMAPMHQYFDISLRRVVHPDTGEPTNFVAANSLSDLVYPHNRFGHVRYPGRYFGRGQATGAFQDRSDFATSMPLLALGGNDALTTWQGADDTRLDPPNATAPGWFPSAHPSSRTFNSVSGELFGLFNGWLLPEFELGDPNPRPNPAVPVSHWHRAYVSTNDPRWDRTGEDVIASNILSFDLRGFDPGAPIFATAGMDEAPGVAGFDDDLSGTADDTDTVGLQFSSELGTVGSDDETITVNDIGISALLTLNNDTGFDILDLRDNAPSNTYSKSPGHYAALVGQGGFVDLCYPYLNGTPLQSLMASSGQASTPPMPVVADAEVARNYTTFLNSSYSAFPIPTNGLDSLKYSGKLVHRGTAGSIVYFQPTYDTWTNGYEADGFDQSQRSDLSLTGGTPSGTTWVLNNASGLTKTPRGGAGAWRIDSGRFDSSFQECPPPFLSDLQAISVTVRLEDPPTGEITQFTIVEGLQ
ncbi:PilW family protein [Rhodopirellula europaea]|uniref:PilW family protein n=1 Tax=Rhodopirellula europaea TaxID=1263866 RepID=UPI003D2B522C